MHLKQTFSTENDSALKLNELIKTETEHSGIANLKGERRLVRKIVQFKNLG